MGVRVKWRVKCGLSVACVGPGGHSERAEKRLTLREQRGACGLSVLRTEPIVACGVAGVTGSAGVNGAGAVGCI